VPQDSPCIVESGRRCEHDGGVESSVSESIHPVSCGDLVEQGSGDGGDLGKGVCFAKEAGPELAAADGCVEDGRDEQDAHIASEDEDGHGGGDEVFVEQDEKQGAEQELVGHGVKVGANHGALVKKACEGAVERVGKSRDDEKPKAEQVVIFKDGRYQERGEADAQQRKQVGRGAERIDV